MNITVFCASSQPRDARIEAVAHELGHRIAAGGHTLLYGGSNLGLMGTVSGAALAAGGHVVAVIPTIFSEEIILSQPVSELVRVKSMAERKTILIARSDAFVALPGGIGTLDEVTEVLVANQLGQTGLPNGAPKPIGLLNLDGFYDPFLSQLANMAKGGFFRKGKEPRIISESNVSALLKQLEAH